MSSVMKATIKDVAKAAGVSTGTVDRALNNRGRISDETKKKVFKAVKELGYHRNEFASAIRKSSKLRILIINSRNPQTYMNIFTNAFCEQAMEYEGYGVEVDFSFSDSLGSEDMLHTVESVCVEDYDGILLNASGPELAEFISRAQLSGVPVATYNSDVPASQRVFFSGENHFVAGRLCGEVTAKFLQGKGKIALFTGDETVFALSERIRGFCDVLEEYPNIEVIREVSHGDQSSLADKYVKQLFETKNLPDAIFCNSAVGGVPVCRYLERKDFAKRPLVIAYDEGIELVEMLKAGICTAIIYQEPVRQAKKALSYMFEALHSQQGWPTKNESQIMPSVVLRENCDAYFEHLSK